MFPTLIQILLHHTCELLVVNHAVNQFYLTELGSCTFEALLVDHFKMFFMSFYSLEKRLSFVVDVFLRFKLIFGLRVHQCRD